MKKLLSLTAITILSSTAITNLTNTSINHFNNSKIIKSINDEKNNEIINWNNVKINMNNIFENYKKKSNLLKLNLLKANNNKPPTEANINEALKIAQEKSNEYIKNFENKTLNLNQVINTLSKDNANFKECYDKNLSDASKNKETNIKLNKNLLYKTSFLQSLNHDINSLRNEVKNLKRKKAIYKTTAAVCAIASAGFWAAAWWWFGFTVPWAVGCTLLSVGAGTVSAGISFCIITADKEMPNWQKTIIAFTATHFIGHIFFKILYPIYISLNATVTATSWVFPAILSLIPITASIFAWISFYS